MWRKEFYFSRRRSDNDEYASVVLSIQHAVCGHYVTVKELMLSTHVLFQMTRFTKTLLAHMAFVRFLVRMNTHVDF